jgi:hypothetical protein
MTGEPRRFTIYADFNNADSDGRLRLNIRGSLADLERIGSDLAPGLEVELESEDLRCSGVLEHAVDEGIWVAVIDWNAVEDRSA